MSAMTHAQARPGPPAPSRDVGERTAPDPRAWRMLAVALIAPLMGSFDLFVVNIATQTLRTDLHTSDAALALVVSGYGFAYAAGLVTGGRLGDRYGYRRMFVTGLCGFTVVSLLCGLAQSPLQLVAARLAQGLSAAVMVPQVLSLVTAHFPASYRGRATAWYGAVNGIGAVAGQLLGGLLLEADVVGLGWRAVFLVNVPVGVIAAVIALLLLPPPGEDRTSRRFDPLGAMGVTLTLALVLAPLSLGREEGWPVWTWVCPVLALPAGRLTLAWQRTLRERGGEPVLHPALLGNRPFRTVLVAVGLFQLYFGAYLFTLALLLQGGLGERPVTAALSFAPQAVLFSTAALLSGRLTARHGASVPTVGAGLVITGLGALATQLVIARNGVTGPAVMPELALIGLGNGLLLPPLIGSALARVSPPEAGSASGTLNTTQQFASSLGVTALGMLFFALAGPGLHSAATAMVTLIAVYIALVTAVVSLLRSRAGTTATDADRS